MPLLWAVVIAIGGSWFWNVQLNMWWLPQYQADVPVVQLAPDKADMPMVQLHHRLAVCLNAET